MSLAPFDTWPAWAALAVLAAHLAAGIGLGLLYFGSLWRGVRRFAAGGRVGPAAIALMLGRFAVLGAVLLLASREGALPLLLLALGVLIARPLVARRVRAAAP